MTRRAARLFGATLVGGLAVGFLPGVASATPPEPPAVVNTAGFRANIPASYDPFTDDNGDTFENDIEVLNSLGIALGGPGGRPATQYGPGITVPRDQMASFIAREIDAAVKLDKPGAPTLQALPAFTGSNQFTDVPSNNAHIANINRLAKAGVVNGTTPTTYNPVAIVTRAQVASFINRAQAFLHNQNPANAGVSTGFVTTQDFFTDDETSVHEANINGIASQGIYVGDGVDSAQPNNGLPRNQMAGLLDRLLAVLFNAGEINAAPAPAPTTAGSTTIRPELVSASIVETVTAGNATPTRPAGTYVRYTFDEPVGTAAANVPANFKVYNANSTLADTGASAVTQPGGTVVEVRFAVPNTATLASTLSVATVVVGAVTDNTGNTNPEGDAAIGSSSTNTLTAGTTTAPDLLSVSRFAQGAAIGQTVVDFTFDEATVVNGAAGFSLVLQDNTAALCTSSANPATPSGGSVPGGSGTTLITVSCTNPGITGANPGGTPLSTVNVARGAVDAGAVQDSTADATPLETADAGNSGNTSGPDLNTAILVQGTGGSPDRALFVFDANVTTAGAANLFNAYLADSSEVNPVAVTISATDATQVLASFASSTALDSAVGVSVEPGAVTATTGANQRDEVAVANANASTLTPGRTVAPDLASVTVTATNGFQPASATFTFDQDVEDQTAGTITAAKFHLYKSDGTRLTAGACFRGTALGADSTTASPSVVCAFSVTADAATNANVLSSVLGTVEAAAVQSDNGTTTNPEGAEPTSGGNGTPAT
jgi:hypothetical protein